MQVSDHKTWQLILKSVFLNKITFVYFMSTILHFCWKNKLVFFLSSWTNFWCPITPSIVHTISLVISFFCEFFKKFDIIWEWFGSIFLNYPLGLKIVCKWFIMCSNNFNSFLCYFFYFSSSLSSDCHKHIIHETKVI